MLYIHVFLEVIIFVYSVIPHDKSAVNGVQPGPYSLPLVKGMELGGSFYTEANQLPILTSTCGVFVAN